MYFIYYEDAEIRDSDVEMNKNVYDESSDSDLSLSTLKDSSDDLSLSTLQGSSDDESNISDKPGSDYSSSDVRNNENFYFLTYCILF